MTMEDIVTIFLFFFFSVYNTLVRVQVPLEKSLRKSHIYTRGETQQGPSRRASLTRG